MKSKGKREYKDNAYSNLDHSFDYGLEKTVIMIKENQDKYFQHSAWNFCGYIWFQEGRFYEEIWLYHKHIKTIESEDLKDLIEEVNSEYGYK